MLDIVYKCVNCGREVREIHSYCSRYPICSCNFVMTFERSSPVGCLQVWDQKRYDSDGSFTNMGSFLSGQEELSI